MVAFGFFAAQFVLSCFHHLFKISQFLWPLADGCSLECFGIIGHGVHNLVCMGDYWICDALVLELDCVWQSLILGGLDITHMGAIMFREGVKIQSIN